MKIVTNVSRSNIFPVLIASLALTVSGCASSRYTILEPPNQPVSNFEVLEIRDFTSTLTDEDSVGLADRFADQLHAAVMQDRQQHPGESVFEEVVRQSDQSERVLLLDGSVLSFEKGSRAKRYFIGFGAGKAYCTIQAVFTDKVTGEEVLRTNFDGELSMSLFGGSPEEAVDAVVRAFIDYLSDYFENEGLVPAV